jgi:exopolysaccharide biosynthesis polyprenyl glycosylphosphotransferase
MTSVRGVVLTSLKLADLAVVTASFVVALATTVGQHGTGLMQVLEMRVKLHNVLFVIAYIGLWHFILRACGLYRSYRLSAAARELRDIAGAVLLATLPLVVFSPLLDFEYASYAFFAAFAGSAFVGLGIERRLLRAVARSVRRLGRNLRNVVIVGTGDAIFDLTARLARHNDLGYHVVGIIEAEDTANGAGPETVLQRVDALIERWPIDEVFVAAPIDTWQPLIRSLISRCEAQGITVRVTAKVASLAWAHALLDEIEGEPVVTVYTGPPETPRLLVKRAIDLVGAAVGLLFCLPLFAIVAIAIKLDSRGPVFFAQERIGYNRRRFRALKFRTMVDRAEQMQTELEPLNEASGPVFKIEKDPRITSVGAWLRKTSIDELPQLINVLRGDMSLVGPRPLPVRDVDRIDVRWHLRRFSVKPGITCIWQTDSRRPAFDEWIRLDLEYIDNWSLALDLKILAKTIPAVLSGSGAH